MNLKKKSKQKKNVKTLRSIKDLIDNEKNLSVCFNNFHGLIDRFFISTEKLEGRRYSIYKKIEYREKLRKTIYYIYEFKKKELILFKQNISKFRKKRIKSATIYEI